MNLNRKLALPSLWNLAYIYGYLGESNLPIHDQSCPNTGQYIWPLYVYTGNKNSTGTHHWSRRRTVSNTFQFLPNTDPIPSLKHIFTFDHLAHIGYTLAHFMPTYHNTNRQMCLYHQVKSTQPQTLVSIKDDLANKNNPPTHHYSSCPMSIWHQSNPNTGQCKWPMCSYTGNKFSTGTHHWSGRSMIWQTKRKPLPTPAHPIQQTQSITFPPAQCQPPISNANPSILYQYANPMPINSQYIWPFRSYTGNKLSTGTQLMVSTEDDFNRQCFINQSTLPILCQCIWPTCSYTGNKYLCGRLLVSSEDDFANLHSISQ